MIRWVRVISTLVVVLPLSLWADDLKERTLDTTAFTADLYAQLGKQPGNLFFSPASIATALGMTYAGAKGGTAEQMAKTLHFIGSAGEVSASFGTLLKTLNNPPEVDSLDDTGNPIRKPAYQLIVANALWGRQGYPFDPSYIELVQKEFSGGVYSVDYRQTEQARTTINDWVASQTQDKIRDLIARGVLKPETRLVLTNAIYFKSNWASKFKKAATRDEPFNLSEGQFSNVPFMYQRSHFGYMENAGLQLCELPYTRRELSMVVLLPKQVDGLTGLEKSLTEENLRQWFKNTKSVSVDVTLPKFTFSSSLKLADTLKAMGMTDPFDAGKADFSGIATAERFFISAVIHKAFVAVDEEGTEAAAATAITMDFGLARQPKVFKADHPFLFLIRHNPTGEILFMGRLTDPKSE